MKLKIGVMGSAGDAEDGFSRTDLAAQAKALGEAIAEQDAILLTGATTGLVYATGKAAQEAGALHVGISPASCENEHVDRYRLPTDACDLLIYTGFGLKGRNVVLVRSCEIVVFIAGSMGSLNEFTIAHDEGKIIGCLTKTGGVADQADFLLQKFSKETGARVIQEEDPKQLVESCVAAYKQPPSGLS